MRTKNLLGVLVLGLLAPFFIPIVYAKGVQFGVCVSRLSRVALTWQTGVVPVRGVLGETVTIAFQKIWALLHCQVRSGLRQIDRC